MSESQNVQNVKDNEEVRDVVSSSLQIEEDEDKQDSENQQPETPQSENNSSPKCDEPGKNVDDKSVTKPLSAQTQRSLPESDLLPQSKAGECNLLPVLVERLRSALELCSNQSQNSEEQLRLEDSGVDSEEDLRIWASNLQSTSDRSVQEEKPNLDLKVLEDLLLSDIHTALAHLQETLKRVDIEVLTRYNSTLDSTNKLNLLRLISNLLVKLKIPQEASIPVEKVSQRRRRADRHTIGVSTEELAQARKWLKNNSCNNSQAVVTKRVPDNTEDSNFQPIVSKVDKIAEKTFDKVKEKHIKDAINQQQSLQSKNKDTEINFDNIQKYSNITKSGSKDDLDLLDADSVKVPPTYYNPSAIVNKHNKFMSKKAKIKRANTIDIPNYLKLQSDPYGNYNGCIALRRPIDISDKILSNRTNTGIPSFEPKTENDRKFLALINKNSDSGPSNTSAPYKSFSYRQISSVADKNWNNRFSNIKTAFDKPKGEDGVRRNVTESGLKRVNNDSTDMVIGSLRLTYDPPKPKLNGFRHAPTSPFQKIEKASKDETSSKFVKYGYTPKSSANTLQAKVKIFDHQDTESSNSPPVPPPRTKGPKFNKENIFVAKSKAMNNPNNNNTRGSNEMRSHYNEPYASKANKTSLESKYNELLKLRLNNSLDEEERRKEELKQKRLSDNIYQQKRNSVSNSYELKKRFSHPQNHYEMYPINITDETNIPNSRDFQYNNCMDKKVKTNRARRMIEEEVHPRVPIQKHQESSSRYNLPNEYLGKPVHQGCDIRVKNVAVQTGNEALLLTPTNERSNADYRRQYPEKEARTLCNNVSVQTLADDVQNYSLSSFLNDINATSAHKAPIYYNRDLDYQRQNQSTPQTESVYSPVASISSYHSTEDTPIPPQSHVPFAESSKLPYQEGAYSDKLSLPKVYLHHTPDSYNHYYPDQEKPSYIPPEYLVGQSVTAVKPINATHLPHTNLYTHSPYQETDRETPIKPLEPRSSTMNMYSPPMYTGTIEKKIQNQDISSEGVITRYAGAIGTIASMSASPESIGEPDTRTQYGSMSPIYVNCNEATRTPEKSVELESLSEIQRHNILQRNLVRKLQGECPQSVSPKKCYPDARASPNSPSFGYGKVCSLKQSYEQPTEGHGTQDKINLFEERRNPSNKLHFRPVNVPLPPPKAHTLHPSKLVHPKFSDQRRSPLHQTANPIDTSDEYLMNCASKPSRSIVLSKSESWHQLAMSKATTLQVPTSNPSSSQKPPKPKSPSSMRFSKQFEASSSSDNVKKMEEKIQQYFQGSSSVASTETRAKKQRQLLPKKGFVAPLAKSHTMPHLYDEKIFDDTVDVDKAFDSLFKEATCSDERC